MENTELLRKLKQVEDNAWMLFSELPPCVARTRALHVFLDAKELKSRLESLATEFGAGVRAPSPNSATGSRR